MEPIDDGLAVILPDGVAHATVAAALDGSRVTFSAAVARDNSSVWLLSQRAVRIGNILFASPQAAAAPDALRLSDSNAFGTGHHPTTALCIEAIQELLTFESFASVLDIGVGSGILALTALLLGVPKAVGLDTDADSLLVAAENAQLNGLANRLQLVLGGPEAVSGNWPLVVANVLAAPLIDMAPVLVRRLGTRGRLILSGIPSSVELEVKRAYQHLGVRQFESTTRDGWVTLTAQASW